jgi:vanillate O-demethylase ferredoxin subunit
MSEFLDAVVEDRRGIARDIISIVFRRADGRFTPATAGSHVDVEIRPNLIRQYSLVPGAPDGRYRIAAQVEPKGRGGSVGLFERLHPSVSFRVSHPRNNFRLEETASTSLLFAGGIGVTPLFAMASRLNALGRRFKFIYSVRSRDRAAFLDEIAREDWSDMMRLVVDDEPQTHTDLKRLMHDSEPSTFAYVCGPGGFIDYLSARWSELGRSPAMMRTESFSLTGTPTQDNRPFVVELASSGLRLKVDSDETIAMVLERAGLTPNTSCEMGMCGSCKVPVLRGEPDHRDSVLTEAEKASGRVITVCCSRARGDELVLGI